MPGGMGSGMPMEENDNGANTTGSDTERDARVQRYVLNPEAWNRHDGIVSDPDLVHKGSAANPLAGGFMA